MHMVAQLAPVAAEQLGTWLAIAAAAGALWLRFRRIERELRGAAEKREISPQPLEVKPATRVATFDELMGLERRIVQIETRIEANYRELMHMEEERASKLHGRINDVLTAVSKVEGELRRLPCSGCMPMKAET